MKEFNYLKVLHLKKMKWNFKINHSLTKYKFSLLKYNNK